MQTVVYIIISGLCTGCIYGLIALAFTTIYNSTKIVNFAQGEFFMAGAMLANLFMVKMGLNTWVSLILVVLCVCVIGALMKFGVFDFLMGKGAHSYHIVITTLGLGIVLEQVFSVFFGKDQYHVPTLFNGKEISLKALGVKIFPTSYIIMGVTVILIVVLWLFLNKSATGKAIRAIGYNKEAAQLVGLHTSTLVFITFMLCSAVSGVGGVIMASQLSAYCYMGGILSVKGFAATIMGGMGNTFAGFVGGLIIGLIESFAAYYISSTYSSLIVYAVLLIMLIVKPSGLWPEKGA